MSCSNCGGPPGNQNPLDCNAKFLSCNNPCGVTSKNTAACESLPSQIENFTLQFFGTVVKTEIDGIVSWSLPCSLDVGLPNNPRGVDEGLACYFLRLFADGITGLTGPAGPAGVNGVAGHNAYTVTLHSFAQPTIASPVVQVVTQYNPAILAGIYVNIAGSGWYLVNETDGNGTLLLTLVKASEGASGTIVAGRLVVPSGFPGASIVGPQGPQGTVGPQGPAGNTTTATNGFYYATVGTDYSLGVVYAQVDFINSAPLVLLPSSGRYLVTVVADLFGQGGVMTSDVATLKLYNTSIAADIPGSEHSVSNLLPLGRAQITINVLLDTGGANETVALFGECTSGTAISVLPNHTTISYVKVS